MTSGIFGSCLVDQIIVNREGRQRRNLEKLPELAASIRERGGLIHPIVVTRDFILVAGERRLAAVKMLGWSSITYQFVDQVDPRELRLIELEENVKRQNLDWDDESRAVAEIHLLKREEAEAKLEPWTQDDTAQLVGMARTVVVDHLDAADGLAEDPDLAKLTNRSTALTKIRNEKARKKDGSIVEIRQSDHIIHSDFLQWAPQYAGPKFNLLHVDFPYGIDSQKSGQHPSGYYDSKDVRLALWDCLAANLDRLCAPACQIMFWFATTDYTETFSFLTERLSFDVDKVPLIWDKQGDGILPDRNHGARRTYEWAFLGRRGDRRIVGAKANLFSYQTVAGHPHEKPAAMLEHFFGMLVDKTTAMLDPTAGSGSALRAALGLGARYVLGLEQNEEFCRRANIELERFRNAA